MTLPLETGQVKDPYARRALERIGQQFPVAGQNLASDVLFLATVGTQRKVAFGTATVTVTDGTSGNSANVAHGLSVSPVVITATARETADTRDDYVVNIVSRSSTVFVLSVRGAAAEDFALTNPTEVTVDWIAIG